MHKDLQMRVGFCSPEIGWQFITTKSCWNTLGPYMHLPNTLVNVWATYLFYFSPILYTHIYTHIQQWYTVLILTVGLHFLIISPDQSYILYFLIMQPAASTVHRLLKHNTKESTYRGWNPLDVNFPSDIKLHRGSSLFMSRLFYASAPSWFSHRSLQEAAI